jgi:hypothetical protein
MRIISPRQYHQSTEYLLCFEHAESPGSGYSFPCDVDGKVDVAGMSNAAKANYKHCLEGQGIIAKGVETLHNRWIRPAIGECVQCRHEVELHGFTNTCDRCGSDYNMSGQLLAPREAWGEETNEHISDILRIR